MAKKRYIDEDIRLFEIYAAWNGKINYNRAWAWMSDEAKERLAAKYPWTFPIKVHSNGARGKIKSKQNYWKRQYYIRVWEQTAINEVLLPNYDRKYVDRLDTDHIVPISYGFKHNIAPELIGSIDNLQLIPTQINRDKGTKSLLEHCVCLKDGRKWTNLKNILRISPSTPWIFK